MTGKATYNEFTEKGKVTHTETLDFWWCFGEEFNGFAVAMPKKFNPKLEHEVLLPSTEIMKELVEKI